MSSHIISVLFNPERVPELEMELTQLGFNGLQQQCLLLWGKRWRKYVVLPYTILADLGKKKIWHAPNKEIE